MTDEPSHDVVNPPSTPLPPLPTELIERILDLLYAQEAPEVPLSKAFLRVWTRARWKKVAIPSSGALDKLVDIAIEAPGIMRHVRELEISVSKTAVVSDGAYGWTLSGEDFDLDDAFLEGLIVLFQAASGLRKLKLAGSSSIAALLLHDRANGLLPAVEDLSMSYLRHCDIAEKFFSSLPSTTAPPFATLTSLTLLCPSDHEEDRDRRLLSLASNLKRLELNGVYDFGPFISFLPNPAGLEHLVLRNGTYDDDLPLEIAKLTSLRLLHLDFELDCIPGQPESLEDALHKTQLEHLCLEGEADIDRGSLERLIMRGSAQIPTLRTVEINLVKLPRRREGIKPDWRDLQLGFYEMRKLVERVGWDRPGVRLCGTSVDAIDLEEDWRFEQRELDRKRRPEHYAWLAHRRMMEYAAECW
ncbi:hypothetical protein JCM10213v2_005041 [Rhodosporidiobolus nylandii]